MTLKPEIAEYLNSIGVERVKWAVTQAECEMFRSYCMQKFGWFKYRGSDFQPGCIRHKCEAAWYRFYNDHSRLPQALDFDRILNGTLTSIEVVGILMPIYDAYFHAGVNVCEPEHTEEYYRQLTFDAL